MNTLDIYFRGRHPTSRRFAVCRLIGDHFGFAFEEKLLPATRAKTARQKFQRAFAQEFLCPYDALIEKLQTQQPDDDDIAEAAKHFHVSTRTILSTLVNKGELGPEALSWESQIQAS